ncbi:MAG TPA: phage portal protein [Archaeoglobus sp.]|nr:phage portal protein [Archaeoglobus sp.]
MYYADTIIKGAIDIYRQLILSSGYQFQGESADKLEQWLEGLEGSSFYDILDFVIRDMLIYGEFWLEKVKSKHNKNLIVGIVRIDPKTMDYKRTAYAKIALDELRRPIGYIQKLPDTGQQIEFAPDDIIHGVYNPIENEFRGLGLVESVYNIALAKLEIQESLAHNIYRHAFPIYLCKFGTETIYPTQEDVEEMRRALENLNAKSEIFIPHWVDIQVLEPKNIEKIQELLEYFIDQEIAALGVPKALLFGGEATNRATLSTQTRIMKARIESIQRFLSSVFRNELFKPLAAQEKWSDVPKLVWNPIEIEDLNAKADRLTKYAEAGFIEPDEQIKKHVRRMESL